MILQSCYSRIQAVDRSGFLVVVLGLAHGGKLAVHSGELQRRYYIRHSDAQVILDSERELKVQIEHN